VDDVSSAAGDPTGAPAVVMVATATRATALALAPPAELGRRIAAAGVTEEIDDQRMSRDHATVRWDRGAWVITDRDSRNGTFVDGARITGEVRRQGDVVVRLGHTVFVLVTDGRGHPAPVGDPVVGPELARAFDQIRRYATDTALLVHGESGAGKELAARLYHDAGPRAAGPLVAVNCAAIPEGVAERLLFGARKGAFSGATDAPGHFQAAAGGTLFLDEIAELDLAVQAKLLRALETREVVPVGATAPVPVELGVVAASHRELRAAVAARTFREDLYYRLARATVVLPPLRARKVDVARLVQREVAAVSRSLGPHAKLIELCCVLPWPGNVRELRAAVRQAAADALAAGREVVRADDLPALAGRPVASVAEPATGDPPVTPPTAPVELDRDAIVAALGRANGIVSVAARALGLHRTQLYRLMDKHGIARD